MEDEAAGRRHLLVFTTNSQVQALTASYDPIEWIVESEEILSNNTHYELQGIARVFIIEGIVYVVADRLVEYIN